jgi:hypothetical protein
MKQSITCITLALAIVWAPTASAGLFEDFFQASPEAIADAEPAKTLPRIQLSNDIDADFRNMAETGYIAVGQSSWRGRYEDPKKAIKTAKK